MSKYQQNSRDTVARHGPPNRFLGELGTGIRPEGGYRIGLKQGEKVGSGQGGKRKRTNRRVLCKKKHV